MSRENASIYKGTVCDDCVDYAPWSIREFAAQVHIQHHDMTVELKPNTHELIARDTMQLAGPFRESKAVRLLLNPVLEIDEVVVGGEVITYWEEVLHQQSQDANLDTRTTGSHD